MPPKKKKAAAAATNPSRGKRLAARGIALRSGTGADAHVSVPGGKGRASKAQKPRKRAARDDGEEEEASPQATTTATPPPPPPPPSRPQPRRAAGAAPAPEAPPAAANNTPHRQDYRVRMSDQQIPHVEAAARAAAAAAAAAAVATERTVAAATPALRPWSCSAPFRVAEFARAGAEALGEVDKVLLSGKGNAAPAPLAAAALLAEAEAEAAAEATRLPPPLTPAAAPEQQRQQQQQQQEVLPPPLIPWGKAIALGPGGGRSLVAGKDVLVTLALSEAGKPERPLREVVLLATPGEKGDSQTLQDARDAFKMACLADAAMEELGVSVQGAYCAVEGVVFADRRRKKSRSATAAAAAGNAGAAPSSPAAAALPPVVDYATPILDFLAATGVKGPAPPGEGEGAEARAAAAMRKKKSSTSSSSAADAAPPWRAGDLSAAALSDLTLRLGGGSGYVFCHQGGCEHALCVRDVRLACGDDAAVVVSSSSTPSAAGSAAAALALEGTIEQLDDEDERHSPTTGDFPLVLFRARPPKSRSCQSCGSRRAKKATWSDAAAPSDPAFWCSSCYADAHYGDSGELLVPGHRVVEYRGG